MSAELTTLVRHEWEEGARRLEAERADRARYERLLRSRSRSSRRSSARTSARRTHSRELADAYRDAERWARDAVETRAPSSGWPRDLALVLAAAFHGYQRGAVDYLA